MKRLLGACFFFCLTTFAWGETLVLTVHNDNGDPGEARSVWTQTYFTDDQGRLVRTHRTIQGEFVGDPELQEDMVYHWEAERVWWSGSSRGEIWFAQVSPVIDKGAIETVWRAERFDYRWSRQTGFQQSIRQELKGTDGPGFEYSTIGSRLSEWTAAGFENHRILLNKTPRRLLGIYVQQNENLDGWVATGEVSLSGKGLWHRDLRTRLAHAMLLDRNGVLHLSASFVFEENYLK